MGLFGSIFSSENKKEAVDLSVLGTDLHSHFIPGIDDGAQNMETAISLVKEMHELGYKKLITTPHVMSDYYKNTPEVILSGATALQEAVRRANIPITVEAAAEYYIDDNFQKRIETKELLTFADNHVLVELPFFNEPQNFLQAVFELTIAGYKVVLAHVERYTYWYHDFENYEKLKDREVLFQMNITSLFNDNNSHLRKICEKLIDAEMINILGSDAHNLQHIIKIKSVLRNKYLHKVIDSGKLINHKL